MREKQYSNAILQNSMTAIPMKLPVNLPYATGSGNSKMASSTLKIRISVWKQDSNETPTAIHMLSGFSYPIRIVAMSYVSQEETGSEKSKMAAFKLPIRISKLVHKIGTKFQWLCLCFWVSQPSWNSLITEPRQGEWQIIDGNSNWK